MKVCVPAPVLVMIVRSNPLEVAVLMVCDVAELPFNVAIVPPAPPASVPQENVPLFHISFLSDPVQSNARPAPKSVPTVSPPVDEALVKEVLPSNTV